MDYKSKLFAITALFFLSTLFIFNIKTLLLIFVVAFLAIYWLSSLSFLETTLMTFFLALPFENAIRQWLFYSSGIESYDSYSFFFGISPKIVIGLLVLLLFLFRRKTPLNTDKNTLSLLLFLLASTFVSLLFPQRLVYIITGYSRILLAVTYFLSARIFFRGKNLAYFQTYFIILAVFCAFIGGLQFILQHQLGRFIELTPVFSPGGYTTTDGPAQYRVSGFISHPTLFGSFMCILLPIIIGIYLSYRSTSNKLLHLFSIILILITITVTLGTLSRSTWINLSITTIAFFFFYRGQKHKPLTKLNSKTKIIITIATFICLIPLLIILSTRFKSISTLSDPLGSLYSRLEVNFAGLNVALSNPLTGVGLNNFAFESVQKGYSTNFSAPPHNTIIIFLSELGIPTTLFFLIFLFYLFWPKTNPFQWPPIKFGLWIGLITFIVSSQFQPLFNLDPTFDLFMFTAGIFTNLCQPSLT